MLSHHEKPRRSFITYLDAKCVVYVAVFYSQDLDTDLDPFLALAFLLFVAQVKAILLKLLQVLLGSSSVCRGVDDFGLLERQLPFILSDLPLDASLVEMLSEDLEHCLRQLFSEAAVGLWMGAEVGAYFWTDDCELSRLSVFFLQGGQGTVHVQLVSQLEAAPASPSCCLLFFFKELPLDLSIDLSESSLKLSSNFSACGGWSLQPWVGYNICEHWSVLWRVVKHLADQVLELWREVASSLAVLHRLPVPLDSIHRKVFVNCVIRLGSLIKRHGATAHNKEDAAKSEQVDCVPLVALSVQDLRCHVSFSALEGSLEAVTLCSLERSCEPKVDNFAIEVVIQDNVLRLQISVTEAIHVHEADASEDLLEEIAALGLCENTGVIDVREELSSHDGLLGDVSHPLCSAICLDVLGLLLPFVVPDDILVLKIDRCTNFLIDEFQELLIISWV